VEGDGGEGRGGKQGGGLLLADCTEWGVERARCREQVHGGGNNLVIT